MTTDGEVKRYHVFFRHLATGHMHVLLWDEGSISMMVDHVGDMVCRGEILETDGFKLLHLFARMMKAC